MAAAARAAERENQRQRKQAFKEQVVADAADAVASWENYIDALSNVRVEPSEPMDWPKVATAAAPIAPVLEMTHEQAATEVLNNFQPGFFDFFRGGSERMRKRLEDAIPPAREADSSKYKADQERYTKDFAEWEADTALAQRVLKGDPTAFKTVVEESQSFSKDDQIGSSVAFLFTDEYVHAIPTVHSTNIIPKFRRKQLESGRLSETKMPTGQFNELYQSYVAGVAFKIAFELFRILPLSEIYVTCLATMLNTQTGHQEKTTILSVQFVRETMMRLDIKRIDPTDALANFNHAMKFKSTTGFAPSTPLKPIDA